MIDGLRHPAASARRPARSRLIEFGIRDNPIAPEDRGMIRRSPGSRAEDVRESFLSQQIGAGWSSRDHDSRSLDHSWNTTA